MYGLIERRARRPELRRIHARRIEQKRQTFWMTPLMNLAPTSRPLRQTTL